MKAQIAVLAGDGVGPEVTAEAVKALRAVATRFDHSFEFSEALIGGVAIDKTGTALPAATLHQCQQSNAVLLGAVGGPKWDNGKVRPEQGLLAIRKGLELFANLRPVSLFPELVDASPLKPSVLRDLDLMVVRELTGGIYFGDKQREGDKAIDTCVYTVAEVERIVRCAAVLARSRRKKLTSVDKANVLETSRLWRETATRVVSQEFPDITLEHMLVDSASMHLLRRPSDFDVLVTENMFGDILTDEASMLAGSMGMLPSASLGVGTLGLYEPIHGSAPDIAGRGIANPYASILSAAMLLRYSLKLDREAQALEQACALTIKLGVLPVDVAASEPATTRQVGDAVVRALA